MYNIGDKVFFKDNDGSKIWGYDKLNEYVINNKYYHSFNLKMPLYTIENKDNIHDITENYLNMYNEES